MRVTVVEVGPRDGLQNEPVVLATGVRAEICKRLAATGIPRIEAVSFVHPARVPQMGGAEEVVRALPEDGKTRYAGLVLNEKGYERLRAVGLEEVHVAFAATETLNRRNQNASVEESVAVAERIVQRARAEGIRVRVTIAASFGCPFEGHVDPGRVLGLAERVAEAGADEIVFADTIGVAVPRQVRHLVRRGVQLGRAVGVHLHNTRNTGLANAYVAVEEGAGAVDASVGGIGGCPFAPGAAGNIATEDLLYMLEGEGVETGIDLDGLIGVARWLESLLGRTLPGQVYKAGRFMPASGAEGRDAADAG